MTDSKQHKLYAITMDDRVSLDRFQVCKLLTRAAENVKLMFRILPNQGKKRLEASFGNLIVVHLATLQWLDELEEVRAESANLTSGRSHVTSSL